METELIAAAPAASSVASASPYQVVARRYRPQDFENLVGQNHVTQALSNAITTGRIGHAYLFTGARGVGKTSSARIFAKSLNCVKGPTPHPCNECDACISISTGEDIDVIEIDGASNRGVDEIRQLRHNAAIRPSRSHFKVYIIDEVHMLTREAFNALLKTLEEPPGHIKFIFCTTEPTKIPITILSRCQRYDFAGIGSTEIAVHLEMIAEREKVVLEPGVAETLARRAAGSMRDAQSLLEQLLSFAPEHVRLQDVHAMLGTAGDQRLLAILTAVRDGAASGALPRLFEEIDAAACEGVDHAILVEQMLGVLRDLLVVQSGGTVKHLVFCEVSQWETLTALAASLGTSRILAAMQILDQTAMRMRTSTLPRVLLEMALVRLAHLDALHELTDLIEQLKTGQIALPAATTPHAAHAPAAIPSPALSAPRPASVTPTPVSSPVSSVVPSTPLGVWQAIASAVLPGLLVSQTHSSATVSVTGSDYVVTLSSATLHQRCTGDAAALTAELRRLVGPQATLRFESNAPSEATAAPTMSKSDRMRELAEYPLVQETAKTFSTRLTDVR